jgi:hypothetical protein
MEMDFIFPMLMGVARAAIAPVFLALCSEMLSASAPVSLSPRPLERKVEGTISKTVGFRTGLELIEYTAPWPISGGGSRAELNIPLASANANIQIVQAPAPFDFSKDDELIQFLKSILPPDAETCEFEPLRRNLLRINRKDTAELIVTYSTYGRRLQLSTLIAQRAPGSEYFLFQVSSDPADFRKLYRVFQASLYSLINF